MSLSRAVATVMVWAAAAVPVSAALYENEKFVLYADFRVRLEADWDSTLPGGVGQREDRERMRVRARIGFDYRHNDVVSFGMRLRSGLDESQQSPHITVLGFSARDDTGDADFNFDRWYLRARHRNLWTWVGREKFPFWKPNEMFWDDDVTLSGIAAGWKRDVGDGSFALTGCFTTLPVGMRASSGNLAGAQAVWVGRFDDFQLTVAGGAFLFAADTDDGDASDLLQGNGLRDYRIGVFNAQLRWLVLDRPVTFGVDLMHNAEDYDPADPDPVTALNHDQTDGYVFSGSYGDLGSAGRFLAGYRYAEVELFAVHNSYSQDDWVRWGTAGQTRASNMKGHELRFGYAFTSWVNVLARLYLADAITTVEDGNRLRVDFNIRF